MLFSSFYNRWRQCGLGVVNENNNQHQTFSYYTKKETSYTKRAFIAPEYGGSYQTKVRWAHYSLSGSTVQIVRVIGRLTGLPFGPSSPEGPLGPAGPAAPGGPDSPFSPLSPLGPCNGRVVVRKVIPHITTATDVFLFFSPGKKTETRSETAGRETVDRKQWPCQRKSA